MTTAWLGLGANIGDPAAQLIDAVHRLGAHRGIEVVKKSAIIRTAPWGKTNQPDFMNMVVEVETTLQPEELLEACLGIEKQMGRARTEIWGPRLIDIDVIAYDMREFKSGRLTLPHPYAHERPFVLDPLREIAPDVADWVIGIAGRTP